MKGLESVVGSAQFLVSYAESLSIVNTPGAGEIDGKGKGKMFPEADQSSGGNSEGPQRQATSRQWEMPPTGWAKLNTDATFCANTGEAGAGVIVRDERGQVLLAVHRPIRRCSTAEEAEAEACLEGLRLTTAWVRQPVIVEADCATLITALKAPPQPRARWASVLDEIRAVEGLLPDFKWQQINRERNKVAHELAQRASRYHETMFKLFEARSVLVA